MLVEAAGEVLTLLRIQLPGLEFGDEQLGEWFATGAVVAGRFEVDGLQVLVGKVVASLGYPSAWNGRAIEEIPAAGSCQAIERKAMWSF